MIDLETRQSYSEVNAFLNLIGNELSNKIPLNLRNFFKREMDKTYIPIIDGNTPISSQNLKRKTIAIIAGLNLQYWCKDEFKKRELIKIYSNNEQKYQEELKEKYNTDNIFKDRENNDIIPKEKSIIKYKESIFKKFINKIKRLLKAK